MLPDHGKEGIRIKIFRFFPWGAVIPEEQIHRSILRHQLFHGIVEILLINTWTDGRKFRFSIFSAGIVPIRQVVRVVPVDQTVVKPDSESAFPECGGDQGGNIFSEGGICHLVVGVMGVEHAESVMMLGRKNQIAHSRIPGDFRPGIGIEIFRIELFRKSAVLGSAEPGPFPSSFERIDAPVDEHSHPRFAKPVGLLLKLHFDLLFLRQALVMQNDFSFPE